MDVSADAMSFTAFMERVGSRLRRALISTYGAEIGAEVTADALAYAWEHWDEISRMQNPAGYLYRVGQSRSRRGVFRNPPRLDPPRNRDGTPWFEPGLAAAIDSLSDKQRAAVVLVYGHGWTVAEVAEMWGVTFSTVRTHLERGMARLRKRLGVSE